MGTKFPKEQSLVHKTAISCATQNTVLIFFNERLSESRGSLIKIISREKGRGCKFGILPQVQFGHGTALGTMAKSFNPEQNMYSMMPYFMLSASYAAYPGSNPGDSIFF